jgi:hypothetical protein
VKEYQRQKNNKYILPRAVYNQTIWRIRDYYRLKESADDMIMASAGADGMPRGSGISNTTASTAEKREKYMNDVSIIESELKALPKEYQKGVWNSIMFGESYPLDAARQTYSTYKSQFIFNVANKFNVV